MNLSNELATVLSALGETHSIDFNSRAKYQAGDNTLVFSFDFYSAAKVDVLNTLSQHFPTMTVTWNTVIDQHSKTGSLGLAKVKNIIAVASGKGGVGKSTTSVNLAVALAAIGAKVGLLDADIYGPSVPLMLGFAPNTRPEQAGDEQMKPLEAHGIACMSLGFLTVDKTPAVWRGPMASGALMKMIETTAWGELDYLIVDLPPGTGDIQLTLSQKVSLAGSVIVTTPQDLALLDAVKAVEMFKKVNVDVFGVVENMSTHICSNCGHQEAIFGAQGGEQLAQDYAVQTLAKLPLNIGLRQAGDSGLPAALMPEFAPLYHQLAERVSQAVAAKGVDLINFK